MEVTSTDKDLLEHLTQVAGGSLSPHKHNQGQPWHKPAYHWQISNRQSIVNLINRVAPYMRLKRALAMIVADWAAKSLTTAGAPEKMALGEETLRRVRELKKGEHETYEARKIKPRAIRSGKLKA